MSGIQIQEKRERQAMNRREGKEFKEVLVNLYNQIKDGNIDVPTFAGKVSYLIKNGIDVLSGFPAESLRCRNGFFLFAAIRFFCAVCRKNAVNIVSVSIFSDE